MCVFRTHGDSVLQFVLMVWGRSTTDIRGFKVMHFVTVFSPFFLHKLSTPADSCPPSELISWHEAGGAEGWLGAPALLLPLQFWRTIVRLNDDIQRRANKHYAQCVCLCLSLLCFLSVQDFVAWIEFVALIFSFINSMSYMIFVLVISSKRPLCVCPCREIGHRYVCSSH